MQKSVLKSFLKCEVRTKKHFFGTGKKNRRKAFSMQTYRFKTIRKAAVSLLALVVALMTMLSVLLADLNRVSAETQTGINFTVDYQSLDEQREAGRELAAEVAGEGMVLLKNSNNTLPLASSIRNISVFGKRGQDPAYNGSGSGGNSGITPVSLYDALGNAGFNINPVLANMYENTRSTGNIKTGSSGQSSETIEVPVTAENYTSAVTASYNSYNDAAIIVIGRGGGEGGDLKRANVDGHTDVTEHSLELNDAEKDLLEHVKANGFDTIIYLVNTAAAFELAVLEDDPAVDAILWIGMPGGNGMTAAAQILTGALNPSGRLPAIYPANFKQDPTWFNVGNNNQIYGADNGGTAEAYGDGYAGMPYMQMLGTPGYKDPVVNAEGESYFWTLNYEEGIYMGYRWYETAATIDGYYIGSNAALPSGAELPYGITNVMPAGETDSYYNRYNGVVYPFGYGMSYTSFAWEVGSPSVTALEADTEVSIPVTVTNTGRVAGKEVVQVYSNPPYTAGEIEKATANLITFAKTDDLEPGESETLTLTFNARDLASFDYNDANNNDFEGYELEAGNYVISLSANSHEANGTVTLTVANDIRYDGSTDALNYNEGYGETSEAIFSQDDKYNTNLEHWLQDPDAAPAYISRADWKLPVGPADEDARTFVNEAFDIQLENMYNTYESGGFDQTTDPYYVEEVPDGWTQAVDTTGRVNGKTAIQLSEMAGVPFDDEKWTEFMNQLTYDEMVNLLSNSSYSTPALDAVGKPRTTDADGPTQLGSGSTSWPSEPVQAATFNTGLGYAVGRMVGNESILTGRTGWYGPGMNTNRSPFGGRNFEYFSQDGVHAGIYGAAVVQGATDMGVLVYAKHMVLNDQESYRYSNGGTSPWVNEQAFREIYMRPWEYAIKHGNLNAAMSSYSKVGLVHATGNYMLNHVMLMDEWGFDGIIVTDMYGSNATNRWSHGTAGDLAVRNGVTPLGSYQGSKRISGRWNAQGGYVEVPSSRVAQDWQLSTRDNGGTTINNNAGYSATIVDSETYIESASQWYWVRNTAQRMLYTVGNSNAMDNLNELNIVFDANYEGGEDVIVRVMKGESFTTPAEPVRPGYTFVGWANDQAGTTVASINNTPEENVTYYAMWVPGEGALTVTFNQNYYGAPEAAVQITPYGNPVAAPATPVRSGYTFGGWYTDVACTDGNEADLSLPIYQSYNLYAKWTRNQVTVTFNLNGGNGENIVRTLNQNDVLTFPSVPERDGYDFGGWAVVTGGWSPSTTYVVPGAPVTEDTTYTAQWVAAADTNNTATFDLNYDGAPAAFDIAVAQGSGVPVPASPAREGYTFTGWFPNANGSGTELDEDAQITADTTFYAGWEIESYTVTVNNNYEGSASSTIEAEYGIVFSDLEIETPVRAGHTFLGWYLDAECRIVANLENAVTADTILYAKWGVNSYDITFDYNYDGMDDLVVSGEFGSAIARPEDPVRYGYLFDGWFTAPDGSDAVNFDTATVGGDVTYYAHWLLNGSNVTFVYNDGASQDVTRFVENGEVIEFPQPARAGYTFGGWYLDAALTQAADVNAPVAGNVTYYASWIDNGSGTQEEPEDGGCGSVLFGGAAFVGAACLVAGVALIRRKKA